MVSKIMIRAQERIAIKELIKTLERIIARDKRYELSEIIHKLYSIMETSEPFDILK